jgi:oligopeptidase B
MRAAILRAASLAAVLLLPMTDFLEAQTPRDPTPPVAAQRPKTDTLHGIVRRDDYHWLRDRDDPEVIRYLEAENAYTDARTRHLQPLIEGLYQEMLGRIKQTDLSVPVFKDGFWYYTRTEEGKQYPLYCRRRGTLEAPEECYLDQNVRAAGHPFHAFGGVQPSPDGRYVAFLEDVVALRHYTLRVLDTQTGQLLADEIPDLIEGLAWASDNRTLFYQRADSANRANSVWRHVLGTPPGDDREVYRDDDVLFNVALDRSKSGAYLEITSTSFTSSEMRVIPADRPMEAPRVLLPRVRGVERWAMHGGDRWFIVTNEGGATNFEVREAPDDGTPVTASRPWLAHRDDAFVENIDVFRDFVVVSERVGGLRRLRVTERATGQWHYVTFDEAAYGVFPSANPMYDQRTMRFTYSSFITPPSVYDYDLGTRRRTLRKQEEVLGGYDPSRYDVRRITVRARDGAAVPVSLLMRKGTPLDGTAPLLLYAYGSYGYTLEPTFASTRFSLVDRGMIYAIAHVRGGSEMGRRWYDDGKMLKKWNTFRDFIDVAEGLVAQRYTSRDRLVINGGSAGGLLMGVVVNERPDLFRAVVADVPFVDVINTMLDASLPLTAQEWEQWGNPANEAEYRYLAQYSPYDNVRPQAYPPMLVTTGLNDSQVAYWEPAKWVAKLRATKTDGNVLLLKTNLGAGHGGASGRYDRLKETAFRFAWILDQVGLSGVAQ